MKEQFKKDVDAGLSSEPKSLPSKYFYDKVGDELFVKIMHSPEYYLTRSEFEIFEKQTKKIIEFLELKPDKYFELIELGAGDGTKTKELIKVLDEKNYQFGYFPIDISKDALKNLEQDLSETFPEVTVEKQQGDYFQVLESLKDSNHTKAVLFLGSNIGNLSDTMATKFIYKLGENLNAGDKLLLGVDLIKSAEIVLPAYNDKEGLTREFNLNLLRRINRELDGNFDVNYFIHLPEYIEEGGVAKSYIQSVIDQDVTISEIGKTYHFKKGEKIHTEISRKYNDKIIKEIFSATDFEVIHKLTDSKNYFADYIFKKK